MGLMFPMLLGRRLVAVMGRLAAGILFLGLVSIATRPGVAQSVFADDYVPQPAFAGQSRAPLATQSPRFTLTTVASGLMRPWGLAFLPDGRMLITEVPGRMRIVTMEGEISEPLAGLPVIRPYQSYGLTDVVLDPDFAENRLIYFNHVAAPPHALEIALSEDYATRNQRYDEWKKLPDAERQARPYGIRRAARARLSEDATRLEDVTVLVEAPARRLVFAPDGTLFITVSAGQGVEGRSAQDVSDLRGKVLRINSDGSIPQDNPSFDAANAHPALFALGFRDPDGAAINPLTGALWTAEHGPRGGDEVNIIRPGRNYGWPVITYGREYSGEPVGDGLSAKAGMEQPLYFWSPSIAPSSVLFYTGDLFPSWKGDMFVGTLAGEHLARLELVGDHVVAEERLLMGLEHRIRNVRQGPDGALYLLTDSDNGLLLKLTPKQ